MLELSAAAGEIDLKYMDESGFCAWSEPSYSYYFRGQQKRLEQSKRRGRRLSIIGFFQPKICFVYGLVIGGVSRKSYIQMMEQEAAEAQKINASNSVQLIGTSPDSRSSSGLSASTGGTGKGGDLMINTPILFVKDGAVVFAITKSSGNAGTLTINVPQLIQVIGRSADGKFSSSLSAETSGIGKAGNLTITTQHLLISDRSQVTVSSTGVGASGDLNITANFIQLNNGQITAQTLSGNGGNLNFNIADLLLMRHGSEISTSAGTAQQGGDGGSININSKFIVGIPKENSDITANAFTGIGGNVEINSQGIFGIESRPKPTEKSDMTASSEQGVAGAIKINAPDTSSIQNSFTELPPVIDTNALIANSCISRGTKRQENSFTITGSGALTTNRPGVSVSTYTTGKVRGVETISHPWKKGDPIIEPTGLYRLNNGQLLLSRECSN